MAFKYKCHKCGEKNIVATADFLNSGLGHGGAMADQLGWGGVMMGNGPLGRPGNPFGGRAPITKIEHKCKHCGEKNILNKAHG